MNGDLEAIANGDFSADDEENEIVDASDGFIDDETPIAGGLGTQQHTSWNALQNGGALDYDFFAGIYEQSRSRSVNTTDPHACIRSLPGAEEFPLPLWRIGCRVGLEEEAIIFLLQRATSEHKIRSAFTRGSVRGSIYVEGFLDADMISLLNLTPGIVRKQSGVVRQIIDPSDWVKLLTMQDPITVVKPGQWIRVHNGLYKGDLGFVTHVEAWGAQVLVVPRLKTPAPQAATSLKRKRTPIRPEPRLFDPATFSSVFQRQSKPQCDGTYISRGHVFDHGLLRLNLDLHSISLNSAKIPSQILQLFNLSSHPALPESKFPHPEEWNFEEGEQIIVSPSGKEATIAAVEFTHLEVDLTTNEGIEAVSWYNEGNVSTSTDDIKQCEFHVDWLKLSTIPYFHTSTSKTDDSLSKADSVRWIGTPVIITKRGSPLKGYVGVVKVVLRGQDTASGLKIVIQLTHLDPSSPFQTIVVDFDDVVKQSSGYSLFHHAEPRSDAYMKSTHQPSGLPSPIPASGLSTYGGATPMPDRTSSFSLTPAWDPLSRTPGTVDPSSLTPAWSPPEDQPPSFATSSQIANKQPDRPQHPLLDERLVGASLKVVVVDGETHKEKEVVVSIAKIGEEVTIRHFVYNTSKGLPHPWVTPKYPNPTRDNGLLMVVKGNHCGSYVRRIHHRYHEENGEKQPLILLAVVKKVDGAADTLTGEQLELGPDSLCIAFETNDDKKLNANLMNLLRYNARKHR